jgi:6-phosphogluconolactonase
MVTIEHFSDLSALSWAAAEAVVAAADAALAARGRFLLALAGGDTPLRLYQILADPPFAERVPGDRVHFCWSDERCVPPDHPDSNFRRAWETWLSRLSLRPSQVHRLPGELAPEQGACLAEAELRGLFPAEERPRGFPVFDLILLGAGPDGHTASLFPGRPALEEGERWVVAEPRPGRPPLVPRLTFTLPLLNAAREVLFLVSGEDKRAVVEHPEAYPAGRVQGDRVRWLVSP